MNLWFILSMLFILKLIFVDLRIPYYTKQARGALMNKHFFFYGDESNKLGLKLLNEKPDLGVMKIDGNRVIGMDDKAALRFGSCKAWVGYSGIGKPFSLPAAAAAENMVRAASGKMNPKLEEKLREIEVHIPDKELDSLRNIKDKIDKVNTELEKKAEDIMIEIPQGKAINLASLKSAPPLNQDPKKVEIIADNAKAEERTRKFNQPTLIATIVMTGLIAIVTIYSLLNGGGGGSASSGGGGVFSSIGSVLGGFVWTALGGI